VSTTVVIAAAHPIVRDGLVRLLTHTGSAEPVGTASTYEAALRVVRRTRPAVVLLNLDLPGLRCGSVTAIKEACYGVAVAVFTSAVDTDHAFGIAPDADGFISTQATLSVVLDAIASMDGGGRFVDPDLGDDAPGTAARCSLDELTRREREVLQCLVDGKSNKEIALTLVISECTAKRHVENILCKFGASQRSGAVAEAFRRGLVASAITSPSERELYVAAPLPPGSCGRQTTFTVYGEAQAYEIRSRRHGQAARVPTHAADRCISRCAPTTYFELICPRTLKRDTPGQARRGGRTPAKCRFG